eukprot:896501-Amphidinium_carterae.1
MSTDCLQEALPNSDDDEISWVSRDRLGGTQGFGTQGFGTRCKMSGTSICRRLTKMLRHAAAHPSWHRKARLRWKKAGQSAVLEREVLGPLCPRLKRRRHISYDAFLAKIWQHPDCELYADNGRIAFTRTMRSVCAQLAERKATFQNWHPADGEHCVPCSCTFR